jgi:hypothetical protein
MAFNLDHTSSGNLTLGGSNSAFTGSFTFPKPSNQNTPSVFLTSSSATTDAISGLQSCLNNLVNTGELGTAASLNANNYANNAILINNNNLIDVGILPDSVNSSAFVVSNSGQLVLLNNAKKGSIAFTSNNYKTYVLCGDFNNINNWVGLLNPDNCVDSVNSLTGSVLISGSNLSSSTSAGSNIDLAIEYIYTGYSSASNLSTNYKLESSFDSELANYSQTSFLSNELNSYPSTGELDQCLSNYSLSSQTGTLFDPYVKSSDLGDAAQSQYNVGTGMSCVLCVGSLGYIDASVLPDVSLVESFNITSQDGLTGLSTATIGDVAFDTVNKLNYILVSSGVNAYLDTGNWVQFAAEEGSLLNVNGHTADPNSTVTLYSSDIPLTNQLNSSDISDEIYSLSASLDSLESSYKTSGSLIQDRSNYVLESLFNSIASGKSATGHVHSISDIQDLNSCLGNISAFSDTNLINLEKSYSYKLSNSGSAASCGSLILGNQGKSNKNYSLVQSAGKFEEFGDAQYESIVGKVNVNDNNWTNIINVQLENNSTSLLSASFVSRAGDAFALQGVVAREAGSACLPDDMAKSIYATGSVTNDVRVCTNSSGFSLQVKGQSYWMSNVEMVSVKSSGEGSSSLIGLYWSNISGSNWFSVNQNWFTESSLTTQALSLPSGSSNVYMNGSVAAVVDMDCASWVQPNSINTTSVTDSKGICFTSTGNAIFSGTVYGNASFGGNASFQ